MILNDGIGLGIGTIIVFHLLRHVLKRRPTPPPPPPPPPPPAEEKNESPGSALSAESVENSEEALPHADSIDLNTSIRSSEDSGHSRDADPEPEDLEASMCSEDSIDSAPENPVILQLPSDALRRRKFNGSKRDQDAGEMGRFGELLSYSLLDDSILKSDDEDNALSAEVACGLTSSDDNLPNSSRLFVSSSQFDTSAPDLSMISMGDFSAAVGLDSNSEDADELSLFGRRASQNFLPENFDHSTPEYRLPFSFRSRRSHPGWMYLPSNITVDCDVPTKSVSCYDCTRDYPVKSRSCASIDLGEMSAISNAVSDLVGNRKLDCNAVSNMERIQAELSNVQNEMEKISDKVGELRSQGRPQYRLCHFDISVDDDVDAATSPRQRMLYEMHQMSTIEADLSRRNSDYMWDYDFDVVTKEKMPGPKVGSECEDESVGQLESFVLYRTKRAARDSFRRRSCTLSQSIDALRLSRSDSVFNCVTPLLDDDFSDQKSCSLFDVNRRLSGPFRIPDVGGISDF